MSIGSAFDAYVKNFLHSRLFGENFDPRFKLETIFEAQVEAHNRTTAWIDGAHAFECYRRSGALADLLLDLEGSVGTPRFEFDVKGVINGYREGVTKNVEGMILMGKPDCSYINKYGTSVILDFKVNGFYSDYPVSPKPGYLRLRSGSENIVTKLGPHKDCMPMSHNGTLINVATYLERVDITWGRQLCFYAWLCGCEIGSDFIVGIDQVVCKPSGQKYPQIRIAEHRLRSHSDFQWAEFANAQAIWEAVHSDHIFRDLSYEDSKNLCATLDNSNQDLNKPEDDPDNIFARICR